MLIFEGRALSLKNAYGRIMSQNAYRQKMSQIAGKKDDRINVSSYNDRLEDKDGEEKMFLEAKEETKDYLNKCLDKEGIALKDGSFDLIINSYIAILLDEEFNKRIIDLIKNEGKKAVDAIKETGRYFADRISDAQDETIKSRSVDVYDLTDMLIKRIEQGSEETNKKEILTEDTILIFDTLSVSDVLEIDRKNIKGIICLNGSEASHASIMIRSLGIPCIVNCNMDISAIGDSYGLIDSINNRFIFEPDNETIKGIIREEDNENKDPVIYKEDMKNKQGIGIYANVNSISDVREAAKNMADGIGLFRTEYMYIISDTYPTLEEQFEVYKECAMIMDPREVIIRTADIGYDKLPGYIKGNKEENPALGLRGIRMSLENKDILKTQLKAILMAAAYGNVSVMFPMITDLSEVRKCKDILSCAYEELENEGRKYKKDIKVGIMIETPAAVMIADELAKEVDFFSIGSNDLTSYTLAADRNNAKTAHIYDQHHPAIIKEIEMISEVCRRNHIKLGICGELAGDEKMLDRFIEWGFDEISVDHDRIETLKCYCMKNIKLF